MSAGSRDVRRRYPTRHTFLVCCAIEPKGKTARSKLEFGGDPKDPQKVVDHVLGIVARGVLSRLADMERDRRSRR